MDITIKINNGIFGIVAETKVVGNVFGFYIEEIAFMSDDAIKKLILGVLELVKELGPGVLLSRKIAYGQRVLENFDREYAIRYVVDQFLSSEGLGTLPGYGLAICEKTEDGGRRLVRRIAVNPEKYPVNDL